jgi:glycosyltransferase involved in cell wall biosynthesis
MPSVAYVLPDKMGGVSTVISNLLRYRRSDGFRYEVLLTQDLGSTDEPIAEPLGADFERRVQFQGAVENLEKIFHRIQRHLPSGEGLLVANDWIELAALTRRDPGRTVLQILHGDYDYYYDLAVRHELIIDGFITHSRSIYQNLQRLLPHRHDSIYYLPYGVAIPRKARTLARGPMRLLFVGRLVESKGVFDLPGIDADLLRCGMQPQWTIVGSGECGPALRTRWCSPRIRWTGALPNSAVLDLYPDHDVLVLPTKAEGFPVCLLEAMAAGVVPVVSDIPGGVHDVLKRDVTGYLPRPADIPGFAASIADLHRNRDKLESMSQLARQAVIDSFDIRDRASGYQDLYSRWRELRRPRPKRLNIPYGSRLDKRWVPNCVVCTVRKMQRYYRAGLGPWLAEQ